jgi:hypothetical protein
MDGFIPRLFLISLTHISFSKILISIPSPPPSHAKKIDHIICAADTVYFRWFLFACFSHNNIDGEALPYLELLLGHENQAFPLLVSFDLRHDICHTIFVSDAFPTLPVTEEAEIAVRIIHAAIEC